MPLRIETAACSTPAAAHARPQCSLGPRGDHDVVAAAGQPQRELAELDGRAGEEVRLRIELENVHARLTRSRSAPAAHRAPKNSLTAAMTASISASVWPAEIGSVRISFTIRSVLGQGGRLKRLHRRLLVARDRVVDAGCDAALLEEPGERVAARGVRTT